MDGGKEALVDAAEAVAVGVFQLGSAVKGAAQRGAPKEWGHLRGSATLTMIVNGTRFEGDGALGAAKAAAKAAAASGRDVSIEAEVAFPLIYAARQHEELGWHHEDGHAKYLEQEIARIAPRVGPVLEAAAIAGARGIFPV